MHILPLSFVQIPIKTGNEYVPWPLWVGVSFTSIFIKTLSVFQSVLFVLSDSQDPFKCIKGFFSSSSATKKLIIEHSEKDVKTNGYF